MKIYWLFGQPGSGKTTLGKRLCEIMPNSIQIDGDDLRDIFKNKDYSEIGRRRNIERAQDIALFLNNKGFNVIVSLVTPYKDQREKFKGDKVVEIYLHTTEDRGRNNYHVVDFESPISNFIDIDTDLLTVDESLKMIIKSLLS